jgi:hypothetical protein
LGQTGGRAYRPGLLSKKKSRNYRSDDSSCESKEELLKNKTRAKKRDMERQKTREEILTFRRDNSLFLSPSPSGRDRSKPANNPKHEGMFTAEK